MPDWCFNNLAIHGEEPRLAELREALAGPGGELDFERIDPTPAELRGARPDPEAAMIVALCGAAETEYPYAWRGAHWGCTRAADPDSVHLEDSEEGVLRYRLSTPYSPPDGIASSLALRPGVRSVELGFFQPARGFAGAVAFRGDVEVSREECEERALVRALVEREFGASLAAELLDPPD